MRRVLTEPLADLTQELHIEVSPDSTYGLIARINLQQPIDNYEAIATQRLSLFKLRYNLETIE
jgi:hypothetical protein